MVNRSCKMVEMFGSNSLLQWLTAGCELWICLADRSCCSSSSVGRYFKYFLDRSISRRYFLYIDKRIRRYSGIVHLKTYSCFEKGTLSYERGKAYAKVIMGNGGFYGCLSEPQGVSAASFPDVSLSLRKWFLVLLTRLLRLLCDWNLSAWGGGRCFSVVEETAQTHVFVLSRSLLLNHLAPQSSQIKLLLHIMPVGIVACAFTPFWDNLCGNSCKLGVSFLTSWANSAALLGSSSLRLSSIFVTTVSSSNCNL